MRAPSVRARYGLAALFLALGVAVAAAPASGAPTGVKANEWAGKWKSRNEPNGNMTLTQSGSSVSGSYLGTNLTTPYVITGTAKGLSFSGTFTYMAGDPAVQQGPYRIEWTMSADLRYISGYRYGSTPDNKQHFDFERVGSAPATTTAPTTTAKAPSLAAAAYAPLKSFMTQFDASGFARVADLGTMSLYRTTLLGLTVKVDPKQAAVAKYDPVSKSITFSRDPRTVKAGDLGFGETVWHELTHAIEDGHGDIGVFDNKLYAERNVEYMTHVARSALPILERMERLAKAGASPAKLRPYWKAYLRAMAAAAKLPETAKYPPDLKLMRTWFGFNASPDAIRRLYRSGKALPGSAGANLSKAVR